MCKKLGKVTAKYRWFAVVYIVFMFLVLPGIFVGASVIHEAVTYVLLGLILLILISIMIISYIQQSEYNKKLPEILQTWDFLPIWMRSLEPYDRYT